MGTWISHLRVAEKLLPHFPAVDEVTFTFGNLSPDSGIPNADWAQFDPPKEVTHFLRKGEEEHEIHDLLYYKQYLANVQPEDDIRVYSFRLGYFFHLICDILWSKRIGNATKQRFRELFEKDRKKAVSLVKNEALHHQYDHICKFYSEQEDRWFLSIPYHYLNKSTMNRVVNDSIEAILTIHEKLKDRRNLNGRESSASLLPQHLTTPYNEPLGNISSPPVGHRGGVRQRFWRPRDLFKKVEILRSAQNHVIFATCSLSLRMSL